MSTPRTARARIAGSLLALVALVPVSTVAVVGIDAVDAPRAAAEGGAGASSRVVGRGDIVTSIIGWRGRRARGGRGAAATCRWVTLHDAQIEFLAAVSAASAGTGGPNPVLDSVREHLTADELPDGDLQARICGTRAVALRFVPRAAPLGTVELLQRRMITRLPVPDPTFSPPAGVAIPLHQPVFTSIDPAQWREVSGTLQSDGVTAQVRARPVGLRTISGDPAGEIVACPGPARPFDPGGAGVVAQARRADACTFTYRTPSASATGGPVPWIGTVSVLWEAEWRVDGGGWRPLGVIPRTRLFDRATHELHTSIEGGG